MTNDTAPDQNSVDPVAEATAQATVGATTDPAHERGFDELVNGNEPDPDLAQGESE